MASNCVNNFFYVHYVHGTYSVFKQNLYIVKIFNSSLNKFKVASKKCFNVAWICALLTKIRNILCT